MKIKWNNMTTCPRNVGEKVVVLLEFGFPFDRELTILPIVVKWELYPQGGKGDVPLGFWTIQPNGFCVDSRNSKELGWLPLKDFLPEPQSLPIVESSDQLKKENDWRNFVWEETQKQAKESE